MAQDGPNTAQRWPKMGPRWTQDGPRMAQYGPKMAPGCPIKNIEKPLVFIGFLRFQGVLGGSLGVLGGSLGGPCPQDGPKMAKDKTQTAPR